MISGFFIIFVKHSDIGSVMLHSLKANLVNLRTGKGMLFTLFVDAYCLYWRELLLILVHRLYQSQLS